MLLDWWRKPEELCMYKENVQKGPKMDINGAFSLPIQYLLF